MTLRIEKDSDAKSTTIRLIGRIRSEHLDELKAQIKDSAPRVLLNLDEVGVVSVDVVRFLGICQSEGIEILHCSPYIRDWIVREQSNQH